MTNNIYLDDIPPIKLGFLSNNMMKISLIIMFT